MRKLLAKFGAVVMMAVMLTAISGADTKPVSKTLVLFIDFSEQPNFNLGSTRDLEKGVRTYQEFHLRDRDQFGDLIGKYRFHAVSTLPADDDLAAWYGNESFEIYGEGVIEGISQADLSPPIPLYPEGSIIGGTGRFSGARGEYRATGELPCRICIYIFTFKKPR